MDLIILAPDPCSTRGSIGASWDIKSSRKLYAIRIKGNTGCGLAESQRILDLIETSLRIGHDELW